MWPRLSAPARQARDQGLWTIRPSGALSSVFSRSGFTDGYFTGNVNAEMFGHRTKEDVAQSSSVLKELAQLYKSEYPRIGVDMTLLARQNAPITLTAADGGGHTAKVEGEAPQKAIHRATTKEDVQKSLTKTGGTPFYLKDLACQIEDGLALSAAALNALRREALEELSAQRKAFTPPEIFKPQLPQKGAARPAQPQTPPLLRFFSKLQAGFVLGCPATGACCPPLEEVLQNRESHRPLGPQMHGGFAPTCAWMKPVCPSS